MSGKEELQKLRVQLDEIDGELVPLFTRRFKVVQEVAALKRENNLSLLDAKRENEILERATAKTEENFKGEVSLLMRTMLALSKSRQRKALFNRDTPLLPPPVAPPESPITCAYQGIPGAFSEQALSKLFPEAEPLATEQFEDVFLAVREGKAHYGVVPIENTQTGAIGETYDLLRKYGCFIVGRTWIEIRQCLLAPEGTALSDVREVYSHPEALGQCRHFLQKHRFEQIACRNTAVAAEKVSAQHDGHSAAIASAYAAKRYGLAVLEKDIMDSKENRTSFIVIAKEPEYDESCDAVTITFATAHRAGALCETLMPFMTQNINLARIESRPGTAGNYRFFADLEGNILDEKLVQALRQAASASDYFEVLGCYRVR